MNHKTLSVLVLSLAWISLVGCNRKSVGVSNPLNPIPTGTIHSGQSILVMGQSNALQMAQYEPSVLLAAAQTQYPGTDHIVECAVVGSGELTWVPGSVNYQACLAKVNADGHPVAYIIWWQGESEAGPPAVGQSDPSMWAQIFVSLMNQFRNAIHQPNAEVLYARLSNDPQTLAYHSWNIIRAEQESVVLQHGTMISMDGIPYNLFPHYDEPGYLECAKRMIP